MFYYAQINENNFCNGIMESSIEEKFDNLIEIEKYDTSLMGRKFNKDNKKFLFLPSITASKNKIKSDGTDVAIITVIVEDKTYKGTINFILDNDYNKQYSLQAQDGQATFQFCSNDPKKYTITAMTENWGNNSIEVEVI